MKIYVNILLIFLYITTITPDITDYTRESFILIEEKNAVIFEKCDLLYHLTNSSLLENIIQKYKTDTEIVLLDDSSKDSEMKTDTKIVLLDDSSKDSEMRIINTLLQTSND